MGVNYQSQDKSAFGYSNTSFSADLNFDRYDNMNESQTYNEHFLSAGTTYGRVLDKAENRITAWQCGGNFLNIPYEVNAQGRMESWYRVTPNYVMLHLVYRFNKNPKRL